MKSLLMFMLAFSGFVNANSVIKLGQGQTKFYATGNPGFLKIDGKGSAPEGEIRITQEGLNVLATVDLSSLDTGMDLRNQHMKEKYLKVNNKGFSKARLKIKNLKLDSEWSLANPMVKKREILGELILHGQTQPVKILTSVNKKGEMESEFNIKITDYGIDIPSFMGVTVAETVKINVKSILVSRQQ